MVVIKNGKRRFGIIITNSCPCKPGKTLKPSGVGALRIGDLICERWGTGTERTILTQQPTDGSKMVNLGSNDYLNTPQHSSVVQVAIEAPHQYGAGASGVASGRTKLKIDQENEISETSEYDSVLIYPSGFITNTGPLTALKQEKILVL